MDRTKNPDLDWRRRLAEQLTAAYAAQDNARVVMVAGSVGRGRADRFSDLEIDVYYDRPPTPTERAAAVAAAGARLDDLDEGEDEWSEGMTFGDFYAHTSTFLVETMEAYLRQVVDEAQIAPLAQTRLYALLTGAAVKGAATAVAWQARAGHYPDALAHRMLAHYLGFDAFWYGAAMAAGRDDQLLLSHTLVETGRQMVGALLGLNRQYMPNPRHIKWLDEMLASFAHAPADLGPRLKGVLRASPEASVREMGRLIAELYELVERVEPTFDSAPYRAARDRQRAGWDAPPGF